MQQIYRRTYLCGSVISIKLQTKATFSKNTSRGLRALFQAGTFGRGSQSRKIQTITRLQTFLDEAVEAAFRSCLSK